MAVEIKVQLKGKDEAVRKLKNIKVSLENTRKLFDRETITLQKIFTRRFETQGEGSWSPLSSGTLLLSKPHKPLNDTGILKGSLGGKNRDSIRKFARTQMTFGTQSKVAGIHQFGAEIPVSLAMRGWFALNDMFLTKEKSTIKIPKRAFFYLTTADNKQIELVWDQWANEIVRRYTR